MIAAAIFDWAEKTPERTALEHNDAPWSYRTFADAIARARGFFHRRGLEGDGVVVTAIEHIRESWVMGLALRSLGLTTIAVPSAEAVRGLGLTNVRAVVASAGEAWPGLAEGCADEGFALVLASWAAETPLALEAIPYRPGGHILLTSGTTGTHKKVLLDPDLEVRYLRRRRGVTGINADAVINLFDYGAWTGVGYKAPSNAWLVGGAVTFSQWREPYLSLRRPGLTYASVLPAILTGILAQSEGAFPRSETMELGVGGGTITQTQINEAKARITPHLTNGVAATEGNLIASTPVHTPDDYRWHIPVPTSVVQIVDEFGQPVPVGQIGRLRVDSEDAPTSYLGDEEATRAAFRDGFFYPGDLAVMREDGRFALMGRVTDVINVQGHKLTPSPIEDRLRELLGISGACLASMQNDRGEEELHLVIEAPAPLDPAALADVLRAELSGFPGVHVHYVAALPRNANGKVLRQDVTLQLLAGRTATGVR